MYYMKSCNYSVYYAVVGLTLLTDSPMLWFQLASPAARHFLRHTQAIGMLYVYGILTSISSLPCRRLSDI